MVLKTKVLQHPTVYEKTLIKISMTQIFHKIKHDPRCLWRSHKVSFMFFFHKSKFDLKNSMKATFWNFVKSFRDFLYFRIVCLTSNLLTYLWKTFVFVLYYDLARFLNGDWKNLKLSIIYNLTIFTMELVLHLSGSDTAT